MGEDHPVPWASSQSAGAPRQLTMPSACVFVRPKAVRVNGCSLTISKDTDCNGVECTQRDERGEVIEAPQTQPCIATQHNTYPQQKHMSYTSVTKPHTHTHMHARTHTWVGGVLRRLTAESAGCDSLGLSNRDGSECITCINPYPPAVGQYQLISIWNKQ